MISKLNDEDALDMLMTSEFEEKYSPMEYKSMLLKWRYFYRILFSRMERMKGDRDFEIEKLKEQIGSSEAKAFRYEAISMQRQEIITRMKGRKLTWKERITGKIIIQEDEDKGF